MKLLKLPAIFFYCVSWESTFLLDLIHPRHLSNTIIFLLRGDIKNKLLLHDHLLTSPRPANINAIRNNF